MNIMSEYQRKTRCIYMIEHFYWIKVRVYMHLPLHSERQQLCHSFSTLVLYQNQYHLCSTSRMTETLSRELRFSIASLVKF